MPIKLAIDFGTTNTVIARWDDGVQTVTLPSLSTVLDGAQALVPSLVYVRDGRTSEVVIGQAVRQQGLDAAHDNRLFRNFKRGIVSLPAPEPRVIDGIDWGDRAVGETFLRVLLNALPKGQVEQLVLTAPVAAFERYLSWLNGVMGDLAANQVYIVDESTAAALGYAVTEPGAPVLVFDFGGGTLDLSLVQLPESRELTGGILSRLRRGNTARNTARVIAKAGRVIGGSDIDQWLLAWALDRLNLTPDDLGDHYTSLLTSCERAKITLSTQPAAVITVEIGDKPQHLPITRTKLEALLSAHGFYDTLRHIVDKVMHVAHRSGIFKEDVKHVLLVGGVSLIPSVQATLKAYFGDAAVRADKPFTAVAEGALLVAAGYGLDDYLSQSYGLRYLDPDTRQPRYDEIMPMGSRYPTVKPVEVELGAAHAGQAAVEFVIGEISTESGGMLEVNYEGGQTVFVAQADTAGERVTPLNADSAIHVQLNPLGTLGEPRLRARFTVDSQRRLRVSITDLKTRRTLLTDSVIATLGTPEAADSAASSATTGSEPHLVKRPSAQRQLSLRGVATMLNALPPESISLGAAEAALRSKSFGARYNAAVALSKRGDRDARHVMQRVLTDGDPPARATVARHLHGFTWYAVEPLMRQALTDPDSRVHEGVMYALSDLRDLNAYHVMAEALQTAADNVREAAAVGLRDCQDRAAVPALQAVLLATDPDVRVKALEALSNNDSPQALIVVRAALSDTHPDVLYAAVLSLLELAHERALDEVAVLIKTSQAGMRETVLRAFFHATNYLNINPSLHQAADALFEGLADALNDRLPATRMAAFWPLAWMRHERANQLLLHAYAHETSSGVKAHLVRVVVGLMSPIAEDVLRDALNSSDEQVQAAAARIVANRERAGIILTYDDSVQPGTGLAKPSQGR
ncbi:MAG: Hsp70 family protein [Armatimonadetes bacterium]|nr:Hsp70 family protein [Anaerolineae bacterium]